MPFVYATNMASAAPGSAPGVPASFGTIVATTPASRPARTTGQSPTAARPRVRPIAAVPPAPGRDMTAGEVTHCLQHLMAQAAQDSDWFVNLRGDMENHAGVIDKAYMASVTDAMTSAQIKVDAQKAFETIEQSDLELKRVEANHASLIDGHSQQIAALKQQADVQAEATSLNHAQLDSGLRAQVAEEVLNLKAMISSLSTTAGQGVSSFDANLKLQQLEAQFIELQRNVMGNLTDNKRVIQDGHSGVTQRIDGIERDMRHRLTEHGETLRRLHEQTRAAGDCAAATAAGFVQQQQAPTSVAEQLAQGSIGQGQFPTYVAPPAPPTSGLFDASAADVNRLRGHAPQTGVPVYPPMPGQPTQYRPTGPTGTGAGDDRYLSAGPTGQYPTAHSSATGAYHPGGGGSFARPNVTAERFDIGYVMEQVKVQHEFHRNTRYSRRNRF